MSCESLNSLTGVGVNVLVWKCNLGLSDPTDVGLDERGLGNMVSACGLS